MNCADLLFKQGQEDICIVTDGLNMGTSRNTGSDKQTYYKQSTTLKDLDSPFKMAKTLFNGGAMHGDIALIEASLSLQSFYKLKNIGVPFPHDAFGVNVGYKTDHDENKRASSIGPLTSKVMTEQLEKEVNKNNIDIFDKYLVIEILKRENEAIGIIAINTSDLANNYGLTVFNCTNVVYGTGGPSSIYENSVYPKNHFGGSGVPILAGAKVHNFTEWQYGIASVKFPWNLSGTYQQVLPRYLSINENGEEVEFLEDYFEDKTKLLSSLFLKGYQWPFDPRKIEGSSVIDLLVYIEASVKNRKVYIDYTKNPKCLIKNEKVDFSILDKESYDYLNSSNGLLDTPIARLEKMNVLAIDLYKSHNIDITKEYLEINVCSQHQNGGLIGNIWWESNIKHLFPIGEVCGTLGVYRPGGTALNSTQVGSSRASEYISKVYNSRPLSSDEFIKIVENNLLGKIDFIKKIQLGKNNNIDKFIKKSQSIMSKNAGFIRIEENIKTSIIEISNLLNNFLEIIEIDTINYLPKVFRFYDMLCSQLILLYSILEYINKNGDSRGSYLISNDDGKHIFNSDDFQIRYNLENNLLDEVCEAKIKGYENFLVDFEWVKTRAIPEDEGWFENVWAEYRNQNIYIATLQN